MITIRNASFGYHRIESGIHDISLQVSPGECLLLCGRSGCGKTTLTRLINGLIPHFFQGDFAGEVLVAGHSVPDSPLYETALRVGSVFQNPRTQFFNVDTDGEIVFNLENAGLSPKMIRERLEQVTEDLGIRNLRNRSLFELSGGEKQKIAFASAYAFSPAVFVLDEPSANLDPESILALARYLSMIKKQGKTIVIAEHRLYYLMELADRVIYMEDGRITARYSRQEFGAIPREQLASMGLREREMGLPPVKRWCSGCAEKKRERFVLDSVAIRRGKRRLLEDISLEATTGDVLGIVGQNGVGKSTFLRTLAGLHKKQDGQICWKGNPLSAKKRLDVCSLVMQDVGYQLFAESVRKECTFGLREPDAALAAEILAQLGLSALADRHPQTLSGGQKQRLVIASALTLGKEILLFDEPTSGLDYDSMASVGKLFSSLARQGRLIVVVSHDYEFISAVCSRILELGRGRVLKDLSLEAD